MRLLGRGYPGRLEFGPQAERGELADRGRQQVDADAQRPQFGRGIGEHGLDARGVQAERGRKARDPGPGDECAHPKCLFRQAPVLTLGGRAAAWAQMRWGNYRVTRGEDDSDDRGGRAPG